MPIYAYKCASCGFSRDILQKLSDDPLSECPSCGVPSFQKQLTAAGFQLKGSGWYVTDFKGGKAPAAGAAEAKPDDAASGAAAATGKTKGAESKDGKTVAAPPVTGGEAAAPAAKTPAPAPAAAIPRASAATSADARPGQT